VPKASLPAYLPILVVERSQLAGLAATTDAVKDGLTPLFDVVRLDGAPSRAGRLGAPLATRHAEVQLAEILGAVSRAWDVGHPAFLDCRTGRGDERLPDGRVHLAWLLDEARRRGLPLIPVTGLRRPSPYQLAVADAAHVDGRGACLRLELPDFHELGALEARIDAIVDQLGLTPERIDLVVDLGLIAHAEVALLEVTARAVLAPVARAASWRTVTLAASSLPGRDDRDPIWARDAEPTAPRTIARTEWLLWRALARASSPVGRSLRFGDYGAQWAADGGRATRDGHHPVYYTHDSEWLVLDAAPQEVPAAAGAGAADATSVASVAGGVGGLVARPEFHGAAHCAGDACFADCEPNDAGAPDPAVWRAAATTHHLTMVVEQLERI